MNEIQVTMNLEVFPGSETRLLGILIRMVIRIISEEQKNRFIYHSPIDH